MSAASSPLRSLISPSILSSDLSILSSECQRLIDNGADWFHIDVIDGHFAPNLTFGVPVVASLRPRHPGVVFDVHMMVTNPEQWVRAMADAGANNYTFHIESTADAPALIASIRAAGMSPGITLRPATPLESILPYVELVDMVLVMTVNPGFSGQSFMPCQLAKVRTLRAAYPNMNIEIDGGITLTTIDQAADAGANVIVSGSAIFNAKDMKATIAGLRASVDKNLNK